MRRIRLDVTWMMIWNVRIRYGILSDSGEYYWLPFFLLSFCLQSFSSASTLCLILIHLTFSSAPKFSLCFPTSFIQLNDLRRQQSVIFIVATNRLRSFDAAVTRPGRFDFLLFVGTPNLQSREKRLESRLEGTRMTPAKRLDIPSLSMILSIIYPFRS